MFFQLFLGGRTEKTMPGVGVVWEVGWEVVG
jgi:hypothetical protein